MIVQMERNNIVYSFLKCLGVSCIVSSFIVFFLASYIPVIDLEASNSLLNNVLTLCRRVAPAVLLLLLFLKILFFLLEHFVVSIHIRADGLLLQPFFDHIKSNPDGEHDTQNSLEQTHRTVKTTDDFWYIPSSVCTNLRLYNFMNWMIVRWDNPLLDPQHASKFVFINKKHINQTDIQRLKTYIQTQV